MAARPDTGTGRDTRAHVAAGHHTATATTTTRGDQMRTTEHTPAEQPDDDYRALLIERFGPLAAVARERAATPAELIRLPQRRRVERRAAA